MNSESDFGRREALATRLARFIDDHDALNALVLKLSFLSDVNLQDAPLVAHPNGHLTDEALAIVKH